MLKTTTQTLAATFIAMTAYFTADADVITPLLTRSAPPGCPIETTVIDNYSMNKARAAEASSDQITVSVILDNNRGQEVQNVLAISADPLKPKMYQGSLVGSVYQINAEPGIYDVVVYVKSDNESVGIFLFEENVELAGNKRILLNQRNAKTSTEIGRKSPDGNELTLPALGDAGNCSIADHLLVLRHNDFGTILMDETAAFRKSCTSIAVNLIPKRFTLTRMDAFAWQDGPVFMVIPIDMEKEYNGPTGNWQTISASFAQTPMSKAWNSTQTPPAFAMTGYLVAADKQCCAYIGMGNYNHEFLTDRCYYWAPEEYDGRYEYYPVLRDGLIAMADASVSSMPYHLTSDGLVPSGLNLVCSSNLMLNGGSFPDKGHPRFSSPLPEDALLVNAVPALVCIPSSTDRNIWDNGFQYGFTGRYGEELGIDSYNFSDVLSDTELKQIGGYHRTLSVTRDGKEICSAPGDFVKWLEWGDGDTYTMDIEMSNVLIDNSIQGVNTASMSYKASDGYIPTVTALQLRENDNVTDRFDNQEKASVEITAATFSFNGLKKFNFKAPSAVKAEYAPHGSTEFSPLELTEIPEYFYLPGYGNFYTASLNTVDRESSDKWYDLRITVEGTGEAVQTQILSPAYRLENLTNSLSLIDAERTSECDVYSIEGRVIAREAKSIGSLNLDRGIYIVNENGKVRKIRVD